MFMNVCDLNDVNCLLRNIQLSPVSPFRSRVVKNLSANVGPAGDVGLSSVLGRYTGGGNGNPLQDSCLGNPRDRGDWWATVHRVTKESDTAEQQQLGFTLSAFSL